MMTKQLLSTLAIRKVTTVKLFAVLTAFGFLSLANSSESQAQISLSGGTLSFAGTDQNDSLEIQQFGSWIRAAHSVDNFISQYEWYPAASVTQIVCELDKGDNYYSNDTFIQDWVFAEGLGRNDIWAGDGPSYVQGGGGTDFIVGGAGEDWLNGGKGSDWINGQDGDDTIADGGRTWFFSWEQDRVYGDGVADILVGGNGNDNFYGDIDLDWFYFN